MENDTQPKTAIEHIKDRGYDSRTNIFNTIWTAITVFVTAYLGIAEDLSKTAMVMIPAGMTLFSTVANTLLYGLTKVKDSKSKENEQG